MIPETDPNTINDGALLRLLKKEGTRMDTPAVTGTVHLGKPWYFSKKVWIAAIAFGVALYSAITGKDLAADQIAAHIETTATLLAPLITLMLAVAHVDASERALIGDALATAKTLAEPDAPNEVKP